MDRQVTELVEEQQKALNILKENEAKLHKPAEYLCRHETITDKKFYGHPETQAAAPGNEKS